MNLIMVDLKNFDPQVGSYYNDSAVVQSQFEELEQLVYEMNKEIEKLKKEVHLLQEQNKELQK